MANPGGTSHEVLKDGGESLYNLCSRPMAIPCTKMSFDPCLGYDVHAVHGMFVVLTKLFIIVGKVKLGTRHVCGFDQRFIIVGKVKPLYVMSRMFFVPVYILYICMLLFFAYLICACVRSELLLTLITKTKTICSLVTGHSAPLHFML